MSFINIAGRYLWNVLKALGGQLKTDAIAFFKSFVKDDVGKLAIDAVIWAEANATGSTAKRDAAVAQLKTDITKAGYDVAQFSEATLNWLIESALQTINTGIAKVN